MKKNIHPKYGPAEITCSCGNVIKTGSTVPKMHVEICSACHPFYTGDKKLVDTAGRVDRFKAILKKKKEHLAKSKKGRKKQKRQLQLKSNKKNKKAKR